MVFDNAPIHPSSSPPSSPDRPGKRPKRGSAGGGGAKAVGDIARDDGPLLSPRAMAEAFLAEAVASRASADHATDAAAAYGGVPDDSERRGSRSDGGRERGGGGHPFPGVPTATSTRIYHSD